ncbi:MAG: hypothetical protein QOG96_6159, partial [Pseudonocardiales bacterium]|nr:hypothetical protein [Pseudonocardiales bacterium]
MAAVLAGGAVLPAVIVAVVVVVVVAVIWLLVRGISTRRDQVAAPASPPARGSTPSAGAASPVDPAPTAESGSPAEPVSSIRLGPTSP